MSFFPNVNIPGVSSLLACDSTKEFSIIPLLSFITRETVHIYIRYIHVYIYITLNLYIPVIHKVKFILFLQ